MGVVDKSIIFSLSLFNWEISNREFYDASEALLKCNTNRQYMWWHINLVLNNDIIWWSVLDLYFHADYVLFKYDQKNISSDAFDTEQLLCAMEKLKHGQAVDISKYDFKSYKNNVFPARRVS